MHLQIGSTLIDRYIIEAVLGEGGMGAVYRTLDTQTKKPYAIKEFRLKHLPTDEEVKQQDASKTLSTNSEEVVTREKAIIQFKREAQLLAGLDHPNLPKVTDYFSVNEDYYIVMTLIEGRDAAALMASLEGKPLPERVVLVWMRQIMDAVWYCHTKGVIHRDIKPANIILTTSGAVYLVDFGIAKQENPTKQTSLGARVVTPGYSPPEQYSLGRTDARSDIYSLGATLYAMLTGYEPIEAINRLMGAEMPLPHEHVPTISPSLDASIIRATAIKPEDRFRSVEEMKMAIFEGRLKSQNVNGRQRAFGKSASAIQTQVASREELSGKSKSSIVTSSDIQYLGIGQTEQLIVDDLTANHDIQSVDRSSGIKHFKSSPSTMSQSAVYSQETSNGKVTLAPKVQENHSEIEVGEPIQQVAWSADERWLVILSSHGIYIFDKMIVTLLSRDELGLPTNSRVSFSGDGTTLAAGIGNQVRVWNLSSGKVVREYSLDDEFPIANVGFMINGALMVSGASLTKGTYKLWELQSRREMLSFTEKNRLVGNTVFSRSGRMVAIGWMGSSIVSNKDGYIKVWDMAARRDMGIIPVSGNVIPSLDFSPNDKILAIGSGKSMQRKNISAFQIPTVKGEIFSQDHGALVTQVLFSPDGKILLTTGDDGSVKIWGFVDKSEMVIEAVSNLTNVNCMAFSPNGRGLVIGTGDGKVLLREFK